MRMMKTQYEAIAKAINSAREFYMSTHILDLVAIKIADVLPQVSNDPNFDRARFLKACGVWRIRW